MASANNKTPPAYKTGEDYDKWCKKLRIWQEFTSLDAEKQGPALFLTLEDEAQDAVLELETEKIKAKDGVETIIACLDKLFKKDKTQSAFEALEAFEGYKRPKDLCIADFCNEFERLYNKTKTYGTTVSDDVLAFRLLKAANLPSHQEQLAKATVGELKLENMKAQLKKIFGLHSDVSSGSVKFENDMPELESEDTKMIAYGSAYRGRGGSHFRGDARFRGSFRGNDGGNFRGRSSYSPRGQSYRGSDNFRGNFSSQRRGRNRLDPNTGLVSRCFECDSVNHYGFDCPDRVSKEKKTYMTEKYSDEPETYHVTLFQSDFEEPQQLCGLTKEALNTAVLDCGAAGTVCGDLWLKCYIDSLNEKDKNLIEYRKSSNKFKFGDGNKVCSQQLVKIPAVIGQSEVFIETDVVDKDIPLLLSKKSMKAAGTELNFRDDTVTMLDQKLDLNVTESGHYTIPIGRHSRIVERLNRNENVKITLAISKDMSPKDMALKLHRQFGHRSANTMLRLLRAAGKDDPELRKEVIAVSESCDICKVYKKPPPRPVVGMPTATVFNECVAMDLKKFDNVHLLHLIDHATRLSACSVIRNKNPSTIIREVFRIWISIYGCPDSFLSDNGGEFNNESFREMGEKFNITIKTTAAESPWSNGLCERHNQVIAEMITKTMADSGCCLTLAVCWAINAKNCLQNVHGYSPFQLVFGRNPRLPAIMSDKPPAYDDETAEGIIRDVLNALHGNRQAFVASESSERIRRALRHNVRSSGEVKYFTGDKVYYKRLSNTKWHGPGVVLGQDGQQVLVKHGGVYVRVHPCRLSLVEICKPSNKQETLTPTTEVSTKNDGLQKNVKDSGDHSSLDESDDDDELVEHGTSATVENEQNGIDISPSQIGSPENQSNVDVTQNKITLKKGMHVSYKVKDDEGSWHSARLVRRSGKRTGKYRNEWNVVNDEDGQHVVDFDCVEELKEIEIAECVTNEEMYMTEIYHSESTQEILAAKKRELADWSRHDVYGEEDDIGQDCVSTRWVITPKLIDGKLGTKARLCARGYEEDIEFRTDSPTCWRESVKGASSIISTKGWDLHSIDFKTAFLQGKSIDRVVYLRPPVECKTYKVWKLKKTVYGLADAPRVWFLRLKEELLSLGVTISTYDKGLFFWHSSEGLEGILICFVDDILWGGSQLFEDTIITKLRETFDISKEDSIAFKYIGIDLRQSSDKSICINQASYVQSINPIVVDQSRRLNKKDSLTKTEIRQLRGAIGQMNWLSGISRPEISYDVCEASTNLKNANVDSLLKMNKIIRNVKNDSSYIKVPRFSDLKDLQLCVYADASFANLPEGKSQGGHIIFIVDSHGNSCPISWHSTKIKRVVKSTLAAETLSLVEGVDNAILLSKLLAEVIYNKPNSCLPVECRTDNKSLFQAAYTTTTLSDKRLRVEMSIVREMVERKEMKLIWVDTKDQLADVLTKKGASSSLLMETLQEGFIEF